MTDDVIAKMHDEVRDIYALQHFLMTHPELDDCFYYGGRNVVVNVPYVLDEDGVRDYETVDVARVAELVRTMKDGGIVGKHSSDDYMTYTRKIGKRGSLTLMVPRKSVCTAKVVGTETIVHEAKPAYTEQRELIEWECAPILAEAESG